MSTRHAAVLYFTLAVSVCANVIFAYFAIDQGVTLAYTMDELQRRSAQRHTIFLVFDSVLEDNTKSNVLSALSTCRDVLAAHEETAMCSNVGFRFEDDRLVEICLPFDRDNAPCSSPESFEDY